MILQTQNLQELRKLKKSKDKRIVQARNLTFNREVIEQKLADALIFPVVSKLEDKVKYLDSGLNLIVANIAAKNSVSFVINLEELRKLHSVDLGIELARLKQNIRLCSKAKVKIGYLNARTKQGIVAVLSVLKATTQQASQAISF